MAIEVRELDYAMSFTENYKFGTAIKVLIAVISLVASVVSLAVQMGLGEHI